MFEINLSNRNPNEIVDKLQKTGLIFTDENIVVLSDLGLGETIANEVKIIYQNASDEQLIRNVVDVPSVD